MHKSSGWKTSGNGHMFRADLEDNTTVNAIQTRCEALDYINFAVNGLQKRVFMNMVTNLWII